MHPLQFQMQIGTLPIALQLCTNETIAFLKAKNLKTIIDQPEMGIGAVFTPEGFYIGEEKVMYNWGVGYDYKDLPEMLKWLQQQNLELPDNI